jgi:hypothetical protein
MADSTDPHDSQDRPPIGDRRFPPPLPPRAATVVLPPSLPPPMPRPQPLPPPPPGPSGVDTLASWAAVDRPVAGPERGYPRPTGRTAGGPLAAWLEALRRGRPLPLPAHALLAVITLGGWLLVLPVLVLWRRQRREAAVLWTLALVIVAVVGVVTLVRPDPAVGPAGHAVVAIPPGPSPTGPAASPTRSPTGTATGSITPAATLPVAVPTTRRPTPHSPSRPSSKPTVTPTPPSSHRPTPSPARSPSHSTSPTTGPTHGPGPGRTDPRFLTCGLARAAGYGPYRRGVDPEYFWYWDLDQNGVVCD